MQTLPESPSGTTGSSSTRTRTCHEPRFSSAFQDFMADNSASEKKREGPCTAHVANFIELATEP